MKTTELSSSLEFGEFPPTDNFVEILAHWVAREPDATAFRFCSPDGNDQEIRYRDLDERIRALAARLQHLGLAGKRIVLLYPPGLEFIVALLAVFAAGAVAVPSDLPRRRGKGERLRRIVQDCGASLLLTVGEVAARFQAGGDLAAVFNGLSVLATEPFAGGTNESWRDPGFSDGDLALIQYTSGSTSEPKGVMLTHRNLVGNCRLIVEAFSIDRSYLGASWLPAYHDMGLVGGILTPLFGGKPGFLLSPAGFLGNPHSWLRVISTHGVQVSGGPDFAYRWCADRIGPDQLGGLDLSQWKVAFTGAEPIRPDTLERFAERFGPAGFSPEAFLPCYGLAEATLMVSGGPPGGAVTRYFDAAALGRHRAEPVRPDAPGARELCACGRVLPGISVALVDPAVGEELSPGNVGEIWIQSPTTGLGYWGRSDASHETFAASLPGRPGPHLRTGDLGFLHEGRLYVTGRLKDLLIVRGVNHHPQDLEKSCEEASDAVAPCGVAAFAAGGADRERVVVVAEMARRRDLNGPAVIEAIRNRLAEDHDLSPDAVLLVKAGALPRTSSEKIRRFACRELYERGELDPVAAWHAPAPPANSLPSPGLIALVTAHTGADPAKLGPGTRLAADLGLDSLGRIALAHRLESGLGLSFPEGALGGVETLGDLAALLGSADPAGASAPGPDESTFHFDRFPEIRRLHQTREALLAEGFPEPYFRVHEDRGGGRTSVEGFDCLQFASYNYLGLSGHPEVVEATCAATRRLGTSSGASRLVSGNRAVHEALERELADFLDAEAALVFVGGHATNETTLGHLFGPGDLILHDGLAHNSLIEGARLSGARRWSFPHNDPAALDAILAEQRPHFRRALIVLEGVYSMDGDLPELARFVELKHRHGCLLMIDEAHSLGTLGATGRGLAEHAGIDRAEIDLTMGTLSKALASCGGFIAGSRALVEYLRYTAPGFVYSVGMPPASAAAALAALGVLRREPARVRRLQARSRQFHEGGARRGLCLGGTPGTPVVPYFTGGSLAALALSQSLLEAGINAPPVLHPAVPETGARLRFFLTSEHRESQLEEALDTLAALTRSTRVPCVPVPPLRHSEATATDLAGER